MKPEVNPDREILHLARRVIMGFQNRDYSPYAAYNLDFQVNDWTENSCLCKWPQRIISPSLKKKIEELCRNRRIVYM